MRQTKATFTIFGIGSMLVVILALFSNFYFSNIVATPKNETILNSIDFEVNGGWETYYGEKIDIDRCDIQRRHFSNLTREFFDENFRGKLPIIIEGLMSEWPAIKERKWSKNSIRKIYGNRTVNVASGAGIVYSGGGQTRGMTIEHFLKNNSEDNNESPSGKDFIFDVGFLAHNPQLLEDFWTPHYFESFSGAKNNEIRKSWYILSLGGSHSGLPYHVHAETWLGLVFGKKKWFVYPPGKSPSSAALDGAKFHPLMGVYEYQTRVLPLLMKKDKPLEFVQKAGDVVYLPSNWKHATLNLGEAIGVGGQAAYSSAEREKDCLKVLEHNPHDIDGLRGYGLSLAHQGISEPEGGGLGEDGIDKRTKILRKSADQFYKAVSLQPGDPELVLLLGEVLLHLNEIKAARDVAHHALEALNSTYLPNDVPASTLVAARTNIARFMTNTGLHGEAEKLIREVLNDGGIFVEALIVLCTALAGQGKWKDAVFEIDEALKRFPHSSELNDFTKWLRKQK